MAEDKKRLIYANDVEFALQAICDRESGVPLIIEEWLASVVRKAPTVDAVEVVHGRTEVIEPFGVTLTARCCLCGAAMGNLDNYCPNCGAKMDGERKDND